VKADFLELLKETAELDRHSRWSDVKKKLDSDPRYKAVDSSTRREDWFKDYIRSIEKVTWEDLSHYSSLASYTLCCICDNTLLILSHSVFVLTLLTTEGSYVVLACLLITVILNSSAVNCAVVVFYGCMKF